MSGEIPRVYKGTFRVIGRRLKAKGQITALVEGFNLAQTRVTVEEHEDTGRILEPPEPVEEDFSPLRYKWESEQLLRIGARHPAVRRYLGIPDQQGKYPGIGSTQYRLVLAEVIAEALAFKMLAKRFEKTKELDYEAVNLLYHRDFTDFLLIAHKALVEPEVQG